ncbi:hypothetical protein CTI12_AA343760 [Artemisia annua]|uniref:Uncharacterized protein n=1 Tax=Artemisia annua TaxID=35608 RepID=A0A2U1MTI6_ARTAN|nr:hypothetical protein CTI12_AA343760 [Artemisia annua]
MGLPVWDFGFTNKSTRINRNKSKFIVKDERLSGLLVLLLSSVDAAAIDPSYLDTFGFYCYTERGFSAMKICKNRLRNRMSDKFLADSLVVHIEKDIAEMFDSASIIDEFKNLKGRRADL